MRPGRCERTDAAGVTAIGVAKGFSGVRVPGVAKGFEAVEGDSSTVPVEEPVFSFIVMMPVSQCRKLWAIQDQDWGKEGDDRDQEDP